MAELVSKNITPLAVNPPKGKSRKKPSKADLKAAEKLLKAKPKKKVRIRFGDIFFGLVFIAGLGLLLYPTLADFWNRYLSSNVVMAYDAAMAELQEELSDTAVDENGDPLSAIEADLDSAKKYNEKLAEHPDATLLDSQLQEIFENAQSYNESLVESSPGQITPSAQTLEDYDLYMSLLNPMGNGIMGYISIDKIDVELPIYHGTSDAELQVGAGHLAGSSLPIGGASTHAVIAGHSGLPSAVLFSDLEDLSNGDIFVLTVLGQKLGYEIDSIKKVMPDDVSDLKIQIGQDEVTLITCWPYGINTHRLLVKGHRVDLPEDELDALVAGSRFPWLGLLLTVGGAVGISAIVFYLVHRRRKYQRVLEILAENPDVEIVEEQPKRGIGHGNSSDSS